MRTLKVFHGTPFGFHFLQTARIDTPFEHTSRYSRTASVTYSTWYAWYLVPACVDRSRLAASARLLFGLLGGLLVFFVLAILKWTRFMLFFQNLVSDIFIVYSWASGARQALFTFFMQNQNQRKHIFKAKLNEIFLRTLWRQHRLCRNFTAWQTRLPSQLQRHCKI